MNKNLSLFYIILLVSTFSFSQIKFEKGYFINNDDVKTECLIKNLEWENYPKDVTYKLSENSEELIFNINNCKEFFVNNDHYFRFDIDVDQSSENLNNLSTKRAPEFLNERIYLKLIVDGKAKLYLNSRINIKKYFYSVDDKPVQELIHKFFYIERDYFDNYVKNKTYNENNFYITQLENDVACGDNNIKNLNKLKYRLNNLVSYFEKYNICTNSSFTTNIGDNSKSNNLSVKRNKGEININPSIGLNISELEITNVDYNKNSFYFDKKIYPSIGVELEYILPYNKNKWSATFEPNFSKYKSTADYHYQTISINRDLTFNQSVTAIDFPFGFRHNMFLKKDSKIFIGVYLNYTIYKVEKIESENNPDLLIPAYNTNKFNVSFGIGYNYSKIYFELKIYKKNDIDPFISNASLFSRALLVVRYNIFSK